MLCNVRGLFLRWVRRAIVVRKGVKCGECGFLALRRVSNGQLCAADRNFRLHNDVDAEFDRYPVCFVQATRLEHEIDWRHLERAAQIEFGSESDNQSEIPRFATYTEALFQVIWTKRICPEYTRWIPGLTLKEHAIWKVRQVQRKREWLIRIVLALVGAGVSLLGSYLARIWG
jgi:hypothetical protein